MFNGKRIKELEARLAELERKHASHVDDVVSCRNFTLYDPEESERHRRYPGIWMCDVPSQRILVRDVVEKLLDHLGLQLSYVKGTPTRIDMGKKPKDSRV